MALCAHLQVQADTLIVSDTYRSLPHEHGGPFSGLGPPGAHRFNGALHWCNGPLHCTGSGRERRIGYFLAREPRMAAASS